MDKIQLPDTDGLWATYHHIRKLRELGGDERGNTWNQGTYGTQDCDVDDVDILACTELFFAPSELCGTAQCYAGWYAFDQGAMLNGHGEVFEHGKVTEVSVWVRRRAGLTYLQSCNLFSLLNNLNAIADILTDITGEDRR
jgi:hypothetical protein